MLLRKLLTVLFTFLSLSFCIAQDLEGFEIHNRAYSGKRNFNLFLLNTSFSNAGAPYPEAHEISGFTLNFNFNKDAFEVGKASILYENKAIGDFLAVLLTIGKGLDQDLLQRRSSTITNGFIGMYERTYAVWVSNKTALNLGLHLNDQLITAAYQKLPPAGAGANGNNSSGFGIIDPYGYYLGAGPSIKVSQGVGPLLIQTRAFYTIPYFRFKNSGDLSQPYEEDPNFVNPHVLNLRLEVLSQIGIFVGIDYMHLINRIQDPVWENETRRLDILLGWRF